MSEGEGRGGEYYDPASEQKIVNGDASRQKWWTKQLKSPVMALTEASRRVEEWEEADTSMAGGSII